MDVSLWFAYQPDLPDPDSAVQPRPAGPAATRVTSAAPGVLAHGRPAGRSRLAVARRTRNAQLGRAGGGAQFATGVATANPRRAAA